jgi:hypothetical protein
MNYRDEMYFSTCLRGEPADEQSTVTIWLRTAKSRKQPVLIVTVASSAIPRRLTL